MAKFKMSRRRLRFLLCTTVALLALWIGFSPRVAPGLYNSKLFHPDKQRGVATDLLQVISFKNYEVFFKTSDGSRLHGWMFINPTSNKVFLLHPGNAGDILGKLAFIRTLLDAGVSVFTYEPRGFGLSEGKPSVSSVCEDGVTAFDFLTETQGYKPERIILYGVSLGAAVATYVSTKRQAGGLILQSGFSSLERIAKETVPLLHIYPSWLFPQPSMNTAEILAKPHPPLLILHGEKDRLIPIAHSRRIFAMAASPKQFVVCPHSTHTSIDPSDRKMFVSTLSDFIRKLD
jgi:alpha-beta hydrolase superfamily lysophospholipase